MDTKILLPGELGRAAALIRAGGIVAFPTDTVYGIAAHPGRPEAVQNLFSAKERPPEKRIPVLLAAAKELGANGRRPSAAALLLAEAFWPGALTIVVGQTAGASAEPSVAVRVPGLQLARDLIRACGGELAVTSANRSGGANATTPAAVLAQLDGRIDALLDGGPCPGGVESTVVDATIEPVRVLRIGGIAVERLAAVVPLEPLPRGPS